MNQLINDLLEFSKLNRQLKKEQQIELSSFINEIVEDLKLQFNAKANVEISDNLPSLVADKALIRQVFVNLISNALKFTSEVKDPQIVIAGEENAELSIISVSDNGVGFDMKYHDKLFQVFQRLHSERDFKGTGVGLAIVERIVHRHGGRIWAQSEPNKGAKFNLEFPKRPTN